MTADIELIEPAPAGAWRVALFFIAIFAFLISGMLFTSTPAPFHLPSFVEFNAERFNEFIAIPDEDDVLRVVLLTDSRGKYAIDIGKDPKETVTAPDGTKIRALRVVEHWAVFDRFSPLLEHVLASRPDVIVMPPEVLVREWKSIGTLKYIRDKFATEYFMVDTGTLPENAKTGAPAEGVDAMKFDFNSDALVQFHTPCLNAFDDGALKEHIGGHLNKLMTYYVDGINAVRGDAFITRAASLGVRVLLVGIPTSKEYKKYQDERLAPSVEYIIERQTAKDGVTYDVPPEQWDHDHYCDAIHMNPQGRKKYTGWLLRRLSEYRK